MSETLAPPAWSTRVFNANLLRVARAPGAEAPVWIIEGDTSIATISDQFRAEASEYHLRYAASDHFQGLYQQALAQTGLKVAERPLILDLGSGSGVNSVVPCLRQFAGARVVATDLSGELLAILADSLPALQAEDQVVCAVMDAMSNHVKAGAFDLVTGSAILHHLTQPTRALNAAARALKPGGVAIFLEPFDGYSLIRLAYQRILAEASLRAEPLERNVEAALREISEDIAARTQPDPTTAAFVAMDDKWLFSQELIQRAARACGFRSVEFVPHNDHATLYRDVATIQLRLASGLDSLSLPKWAEAILDEFDGALPMMAKRRMMLEGTIVMVRGRDAFQWSKLWRQLLAGLGT